MDIFSLCERFSRAWPLEEWRDVCNCESGSLIPYSSNMDGWGGYNFYYDLKRSKLAVLFGTSLAHQLEGGCLELELSEDEDPYSFGVLRDSLDSSFSPVLKSIGCELVDATFVHDGILDFFNALEPESDDNGSDYRLLFEEAFGCSLLDDDETVRDCFSSVLECVEDSACYIGIFVAYDKIEKMPPEKLFNYQDDVFSCGLFPSVCDGVATAINVSYNGVNGLLISLYCVDSLNSQMCGLENTFDYSAIPYIVQDVRYYENDVFDEKRRAVNHG